MAVACGAEAPWFRCGNAPDEGAWSSGVHVLEYERLERRVLSGPRLRLFRQRGGNSFSVVNEL